ncbi:MAG TPA: hypothetical protein DDZ51_15995 [Planctomycetaceae bacterium]|nr:hypothetical protein [Planctomycetaceae bacterium]
MNNRFVDLRTLGLLPAVFFFVVAGARMTPAIAADQWTNLQGTSTVTAEMLGMWNGRILLKLENGRRVSVNKEDLEAKSRIQAEARFEELQQRMRELSKEVKLIAEEASAPAPQNLLGATASGSPAVPNAPQYIAVPEGSDLQKTLAGIRDQVLAGHLRVLYDTLPISQQKAFDSLFAAMLAKADVQSLDANRRTLQAVGDVIVSRQRWLFSHPRLALMNDSQQAELLSGAAFLRVMFSEDVMSIEAMKGRSFGETLAKIDEVMAPYLFASLNNPTTGISSMRPDFEVAPGADGKMIAKVVLPIIGPIFSQTFTSLEGRWAWGESATVLSESLQEATKSLEQAPDSSANIPASAQAELAKIEQAVNSLMQAQTRQEFHRVLDETLPMVAEVVTQWSGYQQPPAQGLAGPYGSAGSVEGYSGEPGYAEMMNASGEMPGSSPAGMETPGSPAMLTPPGP